MIKGQDSKDECKYSVGESLETVEGEGIKYTYGYDADGRYAGIRVSVGENVISDIRYGYDDKGNCIK